MHFDRDELIKECFARYCWCFHLALAVVSGAVLHKIAGMSAEQISASEAASSVIICLAEYGQVLA